MATRPRLTLNPRACDRCGRCLPACHLNALRVGRAYIMVDWARCDGCMACAKACDRGAIAGTQAARASGSKPKASAKGAGSKSAVAGTGAGATPRARSAAVRSVTVGHFTWTILEAAAMLSATFAAFMAKELLLASDIVRALPSEALVPVRALALAGFYLVQIWLLRFLVRRRDGTFADALGLTRQVATFGEIAQSVGLVAGGLVATRVIATLYGVVTREFGLMPGAGGDTVTRVFGTSGGGLVLAGFMLIAVGPFVEECVFRGALLRGLEARIGAWPAIVLQALLFAAFHRSWWLLFPMTVLGIALGWLAHERKSLWPAIALHAAYNALSVAVIVWFLAAG
jgi:membrane protease YdiL (CAAX protease family)/NAD-dependent dihydropyrimidine dehydrogenase PreA subunit